MRLDGDVAVARIVGVAAVLGTFTVTDDELDWVRVNVCGVPLSMGTCMRGGSPNPAPVAVMVQGTGPLGVLGRPTVLLPLA